MNSVEYLKMFGEVQSGEPKSCCPLIPGIGHCHSSSSDCEISRKPLKLPPVVWCLREVPDRETGTWRQCVCLRCARRHLHKTQVTSGDGIDPT